MTLLLLGGIDFFVGVGVAVIIRSVNCSRPPFIVLCFPPLPPGILEQEAIVFAVAVHVPDSRCAKLADFQKFDQGLQRVLCQQAIVGTVLALAEQVTTVVNSMTSGRDSSMGSRVIWPRLDEIHLGNVSDGDAFAELSLMPIEYFHQRTVTATTNTSLYYLEKDSFIDLSKTVPELAGRMERMASRYKTLQAKKNERRATAQKQAVVKRAQTTSMEMRVKNIEAQLHNQGSSIEEIKGDVQEILSSLKSMSSPQLQRMQSQS